MSDETLFLDEDGDACLAPPGRPRNLVALPARDENGESLNPETWRLMVERFNTAARIEALEAALENIRELNMTATDEDGHRWANSDLIEQEIVAAFAAQGETK